MMALLECEFFLSTPWCATIDIREYSLSRFIFIPFPCTLFPSIKRVELARYEKHVSKVQ